MKLYEYVVKVRDQFSNELKKFADGTKKAESGLKDIDKQASKTGKGLGDMLKVAGGNLMANAFQFAVSKAGELVSKMIEVRGQFQKYEAVLGNTLGSKSAAQRDLGMLQDLAAQTNFSMMELTDSYVKMVNRGMKPTHDELMQLADLANSTGKSYDQLVEAILDAQTGQFERLKEFGITASKSGDKVKFSFKGVTKEVQFTSSAIGDYIKGLGKLEGVSGSTAEISKTLTGQISNLGDAWDGLLNTMGKDSEGILNKTIKFLSESVTLLNEVMMKQEDLNRSRYSPRLSNYENTLNQRFSKSIDESLGLTKEQKKSRLAWSLESESKSINQYLEKMKVDLKKVNSEIDNSWFASGQKKDEKKSLEYHIQYYGDQLKALTDVYNAQIKALDKPEEIALGKTGKTKTASIRKSADDVIRGGAKATTVNISINKMIEKMAENMNFNNAADGAAEVEKAVLDTLNRVINGAVYTARQ